MSKKRKVAFLIYSLNAGGAERVVSNLANELVNSFDITIIVFYKCTPFYPLDERISITYCLDSYTSKENIFLSIKNHFKLFSSFLNIIKEKRIDLIIGFMTTANIYVSFASKIKGIPCIISERSNPYHRQLGFFWQQLRRISYTFSKILVVQTESIKDYYKTFISSSKIVIIKNPLASELMLKRKISDSKDNIILNVGRLNKGKNQELLINAFSKVNNEEWKVVLVGEGELRKQYLDLIHLLNLDQKVILVGNVNNIEDYYNSASIFVFTSLYEGFPNALTEAMYFGLPCISTDCPSGPSEIIHSGVNGFLIPVENQDELENRLKTLMEDEKLRQKFSVNAVKGTNEFEPHVISSLWENLIHQILVN